jgi:hypothetical protein
MALANDSILVTPGSGATVATHLVSSKEHQVVILADSSGHLYGTKDLYLWWFPTTVHVAAASTVHWDLFNATGSGKILRIRGIYHHPGLTTAVTGVGFQWNFSRTTAVGTGGTTITGNPADTTNAAIPSQITARQKPTGGATAGVLIYAPHFHSEETNAGNAIAKALNILPWLEQDDAQELTIRENTGIRMEQATNSAAGNTGWLVAGTLE